MDFVLVGLHLRSVLPGRGTPRGITDHEGGRGQRQGQSWIALVCPVKECLAYVCRGDGKAPISQKLETWLIHIHLPKLSSKSKKPVWTLDASITR